MEVRAFWKQALLATLLHIALLLAWPAVRPLYAPAFRALGEFAVGFFDPLPGPIETRFEPGSGGGLATDLVRMDTVVHLRHAGMEGGDATFGASSFFHGFVPTAVLLALLAVVAPRPWRAHGKGIAAALLLLHVFLAARCMLAAFYAYSRCSIDGRPVLDLGPRALRGLHLVWHFGWEEALTNYLVPLALFGVCLFGPRSSANV